MVCQRSIERLLFGRPTLYRIKCFLIEVILWRGILGGIFRLTPNLMPSLDATFAGRRILLAACGPGNTTTGPPIPDSARVVAFDLSPQFAAACARNKPGWSTYCGDLCRMPHRDGEFEVGVLYSTLHHVPNAAAQVLRELARVTTERIVLVEGVVPASGFLRRLMLLWYRLVDGGYHYYTLVELQRAFRDLGLHVESQSLHSPIRHMLLAVLDCRVDPT